MTDTFGTIVTSPRRRAPAGTVDCHMHIFGSASDYPCGPRRSYTPPDALEVAISGTQGTANWWTRE